MNRAQSIRKLEEVLLRRRRGLRETLEGELQRFNTSDDRIVGDRADHAVDSDYGAINSQLAETESRELEQIEHALQRVREGTYGDCETCNKRIAITRLRALPYATNCIECQRDLERDEHPKAVDAEGWRDRSRSVTPAFPMHTLA